MLLIIAAGVVTLALSPGDGWGVRPSLLGDDSKAVWGYVDYAGPTVRGRLASTLGVASQVFGALACAGICVSILTAVYVLHASFIFLRGWYEAAHAAGGTRAALPAALVGANTLIWAGLFYGVSQSFVWRGATGVVPTGRRLRPGWAFYTSLGTSLAWLFAGHTLGRMPPLELVKSWMGDTAPKVGRRRLGGGNEVLAKRGKGSSFFCAVFRPQSHTMFTLLLLRSSLCWAACPPSCATRSRRRRGWRWCEGRGLKL
jgi:hypothetical protein